MQMEENTIWQSIGIVIDGLQITVKYWFFFINLDLIL